MVDKVVVKGKTTGEKIFTAVDSADTRTEKAWKYHHATLRSYHRREFGKAAKLFGSVRRLLPDDRVSELFLTRAASYARNPPGADWDGQEIIKEK